MGIERTSASEVVDSFFTLQRNYADKTRWTISPGGYRRLVSTGIIADWESDNEATLEPLIEHVGHLTILATYLHAYAEYKDVINLGRTLIMLSVHDIGETIVGDVLFYDKTSKDEEKEYEAARQLLPAEQFPYFKEFEEGESIDAKFARAVDALAPIFLELAIPAEITQKRHKMYGFDVDKIGRRKRLFVDWDINLNAIFDNLLARYT